MTQQTEIRSSNSDRNQSLVQKQSPTTTGKIKIGEVAGGATAEIAAICCCCPCGIMNLLILIMYKLPAGIFRKALKIRKKRTKKKKKSKQAAAAAATVVGLKNSGPWTHSCDCSCYEADFHSQNKVSCTLSDESDDRLSGKEVLELEEEMLYKFHGAGFWRSPSQVSERNM